MNKQNLGNNKRTAIVLDGDLKSTLSIVRSLGKDGVVLSVGALRGSAMALHSRYATRSFVYPSPKTDPAGFVERVEAEAKSLGDKPVLYTASDATFLSTYRERSKLNEVLTILTASDYAIEIAFDKAATYSQAEHLGIRTIPTILPLSQSELPRLASALRYPLVIKPRHSVTYKDGQGIFGTASFVFSKEELEKKFATLSVGLGEPPLIQKFIKGEEYGVEVIASNGMVLSYVIHHRVRSLSPRGGASVVKETLENGELATSLYESATTLIHSLRWTGPIMVEFKVENDSKTIYLMELNGRFWGSLPLSIASGIDFPIIFFALARNEYEGGSVTRHQTGIATRHFLGDLQHLLRVIFSKDPMRSYLYPSRRKAFRDFFRDSKIQGDIFMWSDPLPSLWEYIDVISKRI